MKRKIPLWLWITSIMFCILEWIALPTLVTLTNHAKDLVLGVLIITFVAYPIYFLMSLFLLPKEIRTKGLLLLLLPLIMYLPIWIDLLPNLL